MLIAIAAPLVVLTAAGFIPLDEADVAAAHHLAHLIFPLIAFIVFAAYVAYDVRKNGWPTFSWRLNPAPRVRVTDRVS